MASSGRRRDRPVRAANLTQGRRSERRSVVQFARRLLPPTRSTTIWTAVILRKKGNGRNLSKVFRGADTARGLDATGERTTLPRHKMCPFARGPGPIFKFDGYCIISRTSHACLRLLQIRSGGFGCSLRDRAYRRHAGRAYDIPARTSCLRTSRTELSACRRSSRV